MTREQIIEKVAFVMDEVTPAAQGNTIVNPQIDNHLDSSAISLMEMLPTSIAKPVVASPLPTAREHSEGFSVEVECPSDFVRLHRLKLRDWIRSVTELHPDGDRLLLMQDYKHIKSTFRRPMASLYNDGTKDIIVCYPPPEDETLAGTVEEFVYVQKPSDATDVHESLIDMLAWHCASVVYSVSGQGEHAEICRNRLAAMIEQRIKHL